MLLLGSQSWKSSWMLNRMKQEGIFALSDIDSSYISSEEKFAHFRPRPRCADVTAAQIWKILHIVAAIAMAVLTREREISTCPLHIPALALNNTRLPSKLKANRLQKPVQSAQDLVKRKDRWLQSSYTVQTKWGAAWGIPGIRNVSLELFDTEAPKRWRTMMKPEERKEEWRPCQLSDSTAQRGVEEEKHPRRAAYWARSSLLTSTCANWLTPGKVQLLCAAKLSLLHHNTAFYRL